MGISTVLSLLPPLVIGTTVDSIIGDEPFDIPVWIQEIIQELGGKSVLVQNLWVCGLLLLIITLLDGLFQFVRGKWVAEASESIARNIREELYDSIQNLPYDEHVKADTGDWVQRCTSDVETIRRFLATQLVEMGRAILLLGTALTFMLSMSIKMTLISMAVVPVIFVFLLFSFLR